MESDIEEKQITPDYYVIAIRQNLEHWNIPRVIHMILRIEDVFLFDRNSHTNVCELTPSYALYHVETRAILHNEFDNDANRDECHDAIQGPWPSDVEYYHCALIEKMLVDGNHDFKRLTHTMDEDETKEEFFERVMEHCRGNSQI